MNDTFDKFDEEVIDKKKHKLRTPSLFKVVMLNDDYTTTEFVIGILKTVFHKSEEEAIQFMLDVHENGAGICGIYTKDVAKTKVTEVYQISYKNDFPLKCKIERE